MSHTSALDNSLRPTGLTDFVGQGALKEHLNIVLGGAKARNQPSGHLLFTGPPGLGKTSLASVVASEMGTSIVPLFAPNLRDAHELGIILTNLNEGDILFIDEIHALPRAVEEMVYTAIEDFYLDVVVGSKPIRLSLQHFTLVGATTHPGLMAAPLRDRFTFTAKLDFYSEAELTGVVARSAKILGLEMDEMAAKTIASRLRGTPRVANRLVERVRDYADYARCPTVTDDVATTALELFGVDSKGLDKLDRQILTALTTTSHGQPVGLDTLAATTGEEPSTLYDVQEPYLLRMGFLIRTPRGRMATASAFSHLGLRVPLLAP